MYFINYRPAFHHPMLRTGYIFICFWAALTITMALRHWALYDGLIPMHFFAFPVFAVILPLYKKALKLNKSGSVTLVSGWKWFRAYSDFNLVSLELQFNGKIAALLIRSGSELVPTGITKSTEVLKVDVAYFEALTAHKQPPASNKNYATILEPSIEP